MKCNFTEEPENFRAHRVEGIPLLAREKLNLLELYNCYLNYIFDIIYFKPLLNKFHNTLMFYYFNY